MSKSPLQILLLVFLLWPLSLRPRQALAQEVRRAVITEYANLATQLTTAAAVAAESLLNALGKLRDQPSQANLHLAQQAWIQARKAYLWTEPLRFGGGPIDDDDGPEQEINSWPIDSSVVDDLLSSKNELPKFTPVILRQRHQVDGVANATLGFQVMAYLLWKSPEPPNIRTMEYLLVCGDVLAEDLRSVSDEWRSAQIGNFRAMFLEEESLAVQRMITGLALLGGGELATMRLQLPMDAKSRMETTSPYCDLAKEECSVTIQALSAFGQILSGFVKSVDPARAGVLAEQTKRMVALAEQLPRNFYEGGGGAEKITHSLILALEDHAASLRSIGNAQGLNIPLEVGPEGE